MALLDDVKLALRVTGSADDDLLQRLIASATREYLAYTIGEIPEDMTSVDVPEDAINGIVLMVKADYDADPLKRNDYRQAAMSLWTPYRSDWGV